MESVVSTIEVKSTLDAEGVESAVLAARRAKKLRPHLHTPMFSGYQPPSILSYVVAYAGPAKMETVLGWIRKAHQKHGIEEVELPKQIEKRASTVGPSIDGIFVLGKGWLLFENAPITPVPLAVRQAMAGHSEGVHIRFDAQTGAQSGPMPNFRWSFADVESGSLLLLFLQLTVAFSGFSMSFLDPSPYLKGFKPPGAISFAP